MTRPHPVPDAVDSGTDDANELVKCPACIGGTIKLIPDNWTVGIAVYPNLYRIPIRTQTSEVWGRRRCSFCHGKQKVKKHYATLFMLTAPPADTIPPYQWLKDLYLQLNARDF